MNFVMSDFFVKDIIITCLLVLGFFFLLSAIVGIVRMPNLYTKIHAGGLADVAGAPLIIVALIFYHGFSIESVKLMILVFMILITSPLSSYGLSNLSFRMNKEEK